MNIEWEHIGPGWPTCPECGNWQGHAGDCIGQPHYPGDPYVNVIEGEVRPGRTPPTAEDLFEALLRGTNQTSVSLDVERLMAAIPDDLGYWEDAIYHKPERKRQLAELILERLRDRD